MLLAFSTLNIQSLWLSVNTAGVPSIKTRLNEAAESRIALKRKGGGGFLSPKQPFMLFSSPPPLPHGFHNFSIFASSPSLGPLSSWLPHPGIDGPGAWIVTTVFSQDHPRPSPKIISQPQNEFTVLLIYQEMEYKISESEKKHDPISDLRSPKQHRHPEQIKSLPQNESGQTLSSSGG